MANMSHSNVTLQELNDAMAMLLIPAMVYVGVMMIVGFVGNVLVVYVFPTKLTTSTQSVLITCLAVFDLLSCIIAMPTEIADIRFFFMFESVFACKMFRCVNTFCAMCSILTLLGIAVDRYRKVCCPHKKQLGINQMKIVIGVSILLSALFSWPAIMIYGIRSADTGVEHLIGKDCSTSDALKHTLYPLIYNGVLALLFIITAVVLCVLYFLVWRTAKKHTKTSRQVGQNTPSTGTTMELSSADSDGSVPNKTGHSPRRGMTSQRRTNKTTTIAFMVTIVFILSFVPHLSLVIARSTVKDFDYKLDDVGTVFFNIFLRSYFVNSAANPIIYGVMNVRFRRECCKVLKNVFCCGRL
ncbi:trace amine-associated receptor 4-like [Haliotis rubra]|uniref:trace amine-associated receptor 4-like n=1 Tax=Haliotis rubra TaxID=36100 RepID=UPI001EE5E884|nr:trace amine-associated receptor 4-like [Haliotis rubra]XP_046548869.1 trace amine-associated receptor 4-like [Haliotis rubra]XP_046548870.1 trace amine-associated receptor 4-like [Haliotis rubra]XP_046548871.1 trace amine-associated receptor 4-like [Haliotis rubra]